jgi:hypothetical protein
MNQNLRPMFNEQALNGIDAREIEIEVNRNEDIEATHLLKPPDQMPSEEPDAAQTTIRLSRTRITSASPQQ